MRRFIPPSKLQDFAKTAREDGTENSRQDRFGKAADAWGPLARGSMYVLDMEQLSGISQAACHESPLRCKNPAQRWPGSVPADGKRYLLHRPHSGKKIISAGSRCGILFDIRLGCSGQTTFSCPGADTLSRHGRTEADPFGMTNNLPSSFVIAQESAFRPALYSMGFCSTARRLPRGA
jgi:hypothetical protein